MTLIPNYNICNLITNLRVYVFFFLEQFLGGNDCCILHYDSPFFVVGSSIGGADLFDHENAFKGLAT
jgi:hypothetical protein